MFTVFTRHIFFIKFKIKIITDRYRNSNERQLMRALRWKYTWFRYTTGQASWLPLLVVVASAWPAPPPWVRAVAASSVRTASTVRSAASASIRTAASAAASSVAVVLQASPFPLLERRPCVASSVPSDGLRYTSLDRSGRFRVRSSLAFLEGPWPPLVPVSFSSLLFSYTRDSRPAAARLYPLEV